MSNYETNLPLTGDLRVFIDFSGLQKRGKIDMAIDKFVGSVVVGGRHWGVTILAR